MHPSNQHAGTIETLLHEERVYHPAPEFVAQANISDHDVYRRAEEDPVAFWREMAGVVEWFKEPTETLQWNPPFAKWFVDGELNACYNCVDRHLNERADKPAIIWEGEPGDTRTLTYRELYREVNRAARMLLNLGVGKGDRVAIYLPMIPEAAISMLACARIGAPHTVVFGGFSPEALRDRIIDAQAKLVITADGGYRRGGIVPLKANTDAALDAPDLPVEKVLVVQRIGDDTVGAGHHGQSKMHAGRDVWWHEELANVPEDAVIEPERVEAEHPLYILYTSGTTGKPKGVLHTTGGYMVGTTLTSRWVFDLKEDDIYWCTADVGWVTGHSYLVYGPLSNGVTAVMYEGTPDYPDKDRWWRIIEKYKVTILYTAPTAIRSFMRWGAEYPQRCDLSSLRLLGSVGEPINPEAWIWYHRTIGAERCPVVDTWWQTETGAIMITPLPGIVPTKPGSATRPFPGISTQIVDDAGQPVEAGTTGGLLVIKQPWPSMLRTIWGDDQRYIEQYWGRFGEAHDTYFTGDGAHQDEDGYFWLMGRVDDVLNVAGHRLGTMELESALVSHPSVAEAAVVGVSHEVKGQGIVAFVTPRSGVHSGPELVDELRAHVAEKISAIAKPDRIYFTSELPKTRSAKIMRRLLRDIAEGRVLGDTTTLADPSVMAAIKQQYEEKE